VLSNRPEDRIVTLLFAAGIALAILGGILLALEATGPFPLYAGLALMALVIVPYGLFHL
jgi:hypothetical protein